MKADVIGPILELAVMKWAESAHAVIQRTRLTVLTPKAIKQLLEVDRDIEDVAYTVLERFVAGEEVTMRNIDIINEQTVKNQRFLECGHFE